MSFPGAAYAAIFGPKVAQVQTVGRKRAPEEIKRLCENGGGVFNVEEIFDEVDADFGVVANCPDITEEMLAQLSNGCTIERDAKGCRLFEFGKLVDGNTHKAFCGPFAEIECNSWFIVRCKGN